MKPIRIVLGVCIVLWLSYSLIPLFYSWLPVAADKEKFISQKLKPAVSSITIASKPIARSIEGYIVTYWGEPISGVHVAIQSDTENGKIHSDADKSAVSDGRGHFIIETSKAVGFSIITAATNVYRSSEFHIDDISKIHRIELAYREHINVSGKVSDIYGNPVEGATLYCTTKNSITTTDTDGRFKIEVSQTGFSNPVLTVIRGGYESIELALNEKHYAQNNGIEIVLEHSTNTMSMQGWINDASGFALSGQRIYLSLINDAVKERDIEDLFTYSNVDGLFEFQGIIVNETYLLEVFPTFAQGKVIRQNIHASSGMEPLSIRVESMTLNSIIGVITDIDHNPLPNIPLTINSKVSSSHNISVNSNRAGEFYLDQYPLGPVTFHTSGPPYLTVLGIEHTSDLRNTIKVPIDYGNLSFSGRITDSHGNPVFKAVIEMKAEFELEKTKTRSTRHVFSDNDGNFKFNNVGRGLHQLSVISRGQGGIELSYYLDKPSRFENITLQ